MIGLLLALLALIVTSVVLLLLARERKLLAGERDQSAQLRTQLVSYEARFRAVIDADTELRRIADAAAGVRAQMETEEAARRDRAVYFESEMQKRRDELSRALEAESTRASTVAAETEAAITARRRAWEVQFAQGLAALEQLQREVEGLSEEAEIQSFGLYKPRFEFATAAAFKERLEQVRVQQKEMLKAKMAAVCRTKWTVDGSAAEGRRMTDQQLKLMLRAFNGECDAIVASVSWKNVVTLQERMRKSLDAVNKLGDSSSCEITHAYVALKEAELQLAHEHAEKVQEEREEQRHRREQMREEERANREIEKDREDAEREEEKYSTALDRARSEVAIANEKERSAIDAKIKKLETLLGKAAERRERAVSQAELTKSGYVYILSNEGTFGPNVFKIGMTRRLDPMDRVLELGGAPVPFHFDVHALVYSEDAPALETKLHAALEPHRVNLVNRRKEFFRVPLPKIVDLVHQHHGTIDFQEDVGAPDYRKTLAIRAEREAMVAGKAAQESATKRVDELRARFDELKRATA